MNFSSNGLIFQLPEEDRGRLQQICEPVDLSKGQILCLPGSAGQDLVYFLSSGSVTLWIEAEEHTRLAVGLVGAEGAVGLGAALGQNTRHWRYEVLNAGYAWQTSSAQLHKLLRTHPSMLWVVARYLWQMAQGIAALTASVQFDDVQTRLAAWLVLCAQRSGTQQLNITHDQLARMLGVRRVSITLAAVALKDLGLLNYKRGSVDILDLEGLSQQAQGGTR